MRQLIEDFISAMEYHVEQTRPIHSTTVALQAARDALKSLPAQEPVAWVCYGWSSDEKHAIDYEQHEIDAIPVGTLLYPSPPQRKPWVGLTQQEQASVLASVPTVPFEGDWHLALLTAIEAKLREKNT